MTTLFLGVDVSKHYIDCFDPASSLSQRIPDAAIDDWARAQSSRPNLAVAFEATGVYGKRLGQRLAAAKRAYAEIHPRQIRRFAQALGQLAKNDRIDAKVIARYAAACGVRQAEDPGNAELRGCILRREQLLKLIQLEQGHAESCLEPRRLAEMETHLAASRQAETLLSMPGVGTVTAASLLAYMPELGRLKRGQAAALAGLAPFQRDSGTFRGRRTIYGGRAEVRRVLYRAALVAIRHNPVYKRKYQAFKTNGKPFKLALTAIMRNMLETLNIMRKQNTCWKS